MEYWKRIITAGNRCFHDGDLIEARELYLRALAQAQMLLERWPEPAEAVSALVVSYHNLGDLHLMLEQPEETAEYLCACHERLLQLVYDARQPQDLREMAQRHSGRTYATLMQFIQDHGTYPRTDRLLDRSAPVARRAPAMSRHYH